MGSRSFHTIDNFLRQPGVAPKVIEYSRLAKIHIFNCKDDSKNQFIKSGVYTGFSENKSIALLKALTERVERRSMIFGSSQQKKYACTYGSDGMAAYPILSKAHMQIARERSRGNAFSEALERYVWATWWDYNTAAAITEIEATKSLGSIGVDCLKNKLCRDFDIDNFYLVRPKFHLNKGILHDIIVVLAKIKGAGYLSGGAAGPIGGSKDILFRGMCELIRHGMAFKRMKSVGAERNPSLTLYEKRLAFFASGRGNFLVSERLSSNGQSIIGLPDLMIDEAIENPSAPSFAAHRCLFYGQPGFINGKVERLCL